MITSLRCSGISLANFNTCMMLRYFVGLFGTETGDLAQPRKRSPDPLPRKRVGSGHETKQHTGTTVNSQRHDIIGHHSEILTSYHSEFSEILTHTIVTSQ